MIRENLHDQVFLDACAVRFDRFRDYVLGIEAGLPTLAAILLMCPVKNVEKVVKKVFGGTASLPGKRGKLIEEVMPGSREEQLTSLGVLGVKSALRVNKSSRKEVVICNE